VLPKAIHYIRMKVNLHPIKLTSTHKVLMDAYYGKQAKLQNRA